LAVLTDEGVAVVEPVVGGVEGEGADDDLVHLLDRAGEVDGLQAVPAVARDRAAQAAPQREPGATGVRREPAPAGHAPEVPVGGLRAEPLEGGGTPRGAHARGTNGLAAGTEDAVGPVPQQLDGEGLVLLLGLL